MLLLLEHGLIIAQVMHLTDFSPILAHRLALERLSALAGVTPVWAYKWLVGKQLKNLWVSPLQGGEDGQEAQDSITLRLSRLSRLSGSTRLGGGGQADDRVAPLQLKAWGSASSLAQLLLVCFHHDELLNRPKESYIKSSSSPTESPWNVEVLCFMWRELRIFCTSQIKAMLKKMQGTLQVTPNYSETEINNL